MHAVLPGGEPHKALIDSVVADRPAYLEAHDLHSVWVNSLALEEMGITAATGDPAGGEIVRDAGTGEATGYLLESAARLHAWPMLSESGPGAIQHHLSVALAEYAAAGVTTLVEMALDEETLESMATLLERGELTSRIVAHMIVYPSGDASVDLAAVTRVVELRRQHHGNLLRVTGIKLMLDGTIDGCTAALRMPYTDGSNADPVWEPAELADLVTAADALGLQVAVHAIGDRAISLALDAFGATKQRNTAFSARHRVEHLEYATTDDIERLGALGLTASMQPVHVDPMFLDNWIAMLGSERASMGFAWPLFVRAGATLAFGTDSPTAPLEALANMYLAATRRSPLDPTLEPHRPDWALALDAALVHGTRDSAYAAEMDHVVGSLRPGKAADVVVLDDDPLAGDVETLLETRVAMTLMAGEVTYRLGDG